MYRKHVREFMKKKNLTFKDLKTNDIPPFTVSQGLCKSKELTIEEINQGLKEVEEKMVEIEKDIGSDIPKDKYLGMAFISLKSKRDMLTLVNLQDDSFFSSMMRKIGKKLSCCC